MDAASGEVNSPRVISGLPDTENPTNPDADKSRRWRGAEIGGYAVSIAALCVLGLVVTTGRDTANWEWNSVSLFGLAITAFGASVAVTIYRLQTQKARSDGEAQRTLLNAIQTASNQAVANSADAADAARAARDIFIGQMSTATEAASAPAPQEDELEDEPPVPNLDEPRVVEPVNANDIIRVEGVGEYLRPPAVPLKVLADLVSWWRGPGNATGAWTVDNLVGAFRPYNKAGTLQGVPWILQFRRSNGDPAQYRVAYSGRKRKGEDVATPSVSRYSKGDARWAEGQPVMEIE